MCASSSCGSPRPHTGFEHEARVGSRRFALDIAALTLLSNSLFGESSMVPKASYLSCTLKVAYFTTTGRLLSLTAGWCSGVRMAAQQERAGAREVPLWQRAGRLGPLLRAAGALRRAQRAQQGAAVPVPPEVQIATRQYWCPSTGAGAGKAGACDARAARRWWQTLRAAGRCCSRRWASACRAATCPGSA